MYITDYMNLCVDLKKKSGTNFSPISTNYKISKESGCFVCPQPRIYATTRTFLGGKMLHFSMYQKT